jgi:hypothetical protein
MKMKELNPRIKCADGISLSVQANKYAYCSPRIDEVDEWNLYTLVEVGFITDADEKPMTPPDDWRRYSDGSFPSDRYGYIPTGMVEAFIADHGDEIPPVNAEVSDRRPTASDSPETHNGGSLH